MGAAAGQAVGCEGGHDSAHTPAAHTFPAPHAAPALPPASPPHAPVAPQNLLFVAGSTQAPPQLTRFAAQTVAHAPALHTCPGAHTAPPVAMSQAPLAPQCWGFDVGSMHVPPQLTWPVGQEDLHMPATHAAPVAHVVPQPPQWRGSVVVSTHSTPHWVQASLAPASSAIGTSTVESLQAWTTRAANATTNPTTRLFFWTTCIDSSQGG